jgi:uncharacterized pyridoxamine 5'-phosphate oxidase family protein
MKMILLFLLMMVLTVVVATSCGGDVRNIYRVLMSRGMKGCYVYFCDPGVKEYFKKHMPKQETVKVEGNATNLINGSSAL